MMAHGADIKSYMELCKVKISLFSAFSAATGFLLSGHGIGYGLSAAAAGVFFIGCGACALNQYQERDVDARMPRTQGRPLPSGRIRPAGALYFAIALICLGSFVLLLTDRTAPFLLGLFAVIWYNIIYTALKRKTAFAVIPGALLGAVSPAIGWFSGGGEPTDHKLIALCFFFFMWQAPHFWLLMMKRGDEYKNAGLPSLTESFSRTQLRRIIFIWTGAAAVSALFIPFGGVAGNYAIGAILFAASSWMVWNGIKVLMGDESNTDCTFAFRRMNIFVLLVMLLLSLDKLFINRPAF